MDENNNRNNGTVPTTEVAPETEKRSPKENNQTKNQREVVRGNREGEKNKIKQWNNLTANTYTKRPEYMEKLTRKESQAMLRARTSMMNVRMNHKNGQEKHKCRFCKEAEETQEHVIQDWLPENKEKQRHYQVRGNI